MQENNQDLKLLKDLGMIYPSELSKTKERYYLYKCFCGNEFRARIADINAGKYKSCGCLKIKHNLHNHRLYNTWYQMINRCTNPKNKSYKDYGGRGIKVCDRWNKVANFIDDMYPSFEEGLTLDRENNDLGYSPDNCRWATQNTQSQNTTVTRNNNTSGYRGVSWFKNSSKWRCRIAVDKKTIYLGHFNTAIEAARAYDQYIIDNNLEHTKNFTWENQNGKTLTVKQLKEKYS